MQQGFQQDRMGTLGRVAIFGIAIRFFYGRGLPPRGRNGVDGVTHPIVAHRCRRSFGGIMSLEIDQP
jgi:hypothetical protein